MSPSHLPTWPPPSSPQYSLPGPQVEPKASFWTDCRVPCVVSINNILHGTTQLSGTWTMPPYPTAPVSDAELAELHELAALRDVPGALISTDPARPRRPISPFLQMRPQPLGAVFNRERARDCSDRCNDRCADRCGDTPDDVPVIQTGRELARYFESETPGLAHRHALNYLLPLTNWSPPRQALVWMALDVAIYSALTAAWYFKWRGDPAVGFRPRPIEADYTLSVLFNRIGDCDGDADGPLRRCPSPSPGTPRHPAYPSGHSTYSAAASEICAYFFPDMTAEFRDLADNIGTARLWAGIHWRSDHTRGQELGHRVARLLIAQLHAGCVTAPAGCCDVPDPNPCPRIQTKMDLDTDAVAARQAGTSHRAGTGPAATTAAKQQSGSANLPDSATLEQAAGPQEGTPPIMSHQDEQAQAHGPQEGAPVSHSDTAQRERAEGPQEGAR